jgi:hypothetical protein
MTHIEIMHENSELREIIAALRAENDLLHARQGMTALEVQERQRIIDEAIASATKDLRTEVERLRRALKWYADTGNYKKDGMVKIDGNLVDFIGVMGDYGSLARKALAKKQENPNVP